MKSKVYDIIQWLNNELRNIDGVSKAYIFGSVIYSDSPNDCDVLIVHKKNHTKVICSELSIIEVDFKNEFLLKLHLLPLTDEEYLSEKVNLKNSFLKGAIHLMC